ncbi:MAG TPA: ImmA/IrrE family metallo-endopeptidase [Ktedonobacteraceae bacterium]|nr:ImmA/IrrE family metallo-endopeptidase [Ktedonobacteraceae bacterium]
MLTSESELESMVLSQIGSIKHQYNKWADPHALAEALEFSVVTGNLGTGREGAAFADTIVLDPSMGVKARQRFTLYHEIVHLLLKRNDELYSILHDQYPSDKDFNHIIERLCNAGAAEFVIPREAVRTAMEEKGFSISLVRDLSSISEVSPAAVSVQLALCAKHECIMTVCRLAAHPEVDEPLFSDKLRPGMVLQVSMSVSSLRTKYRVARGSRISKGHLFYEAYEAEDGEVVRGEAPVPLRSGRQWIVECEAMRIGGQVFGIFHLRPAPVKSRYQLPLF